MQRFISIVSLAFPDYRRSVTWIFPLLIIVLTACVEEVDFQPGRVPDVLVVDGRITTDKGPHKVRLSRVASYYGRQAGDPVSEATVTLLDDQGLRWDYKESARQPGLYLLADMQGEIGRSYRLDIHLADDRIYRSQPELLLPVPNVDSLSYYTNFEQFQEVSGTIQEKWFINLLVHTTLEPLAQGPYLRWEVETVHNFVELTPVPNFGRDSFVCYIHETLDPQQLRLFDGSGATVIQPISRFLGRKRITWIFEFRHYFNVYQSSLTERAYRYWSQVDKIANQTGTIFDPPAAAIRGNVYNSIDPDEIVLGYFGASAIDTARIFTTRSDLPGVTILPYCGSYLARPVPIPPACFNCKLLPNSTYVRPDYF